MKKIIFFLLLNSTVYGQVEKTEPPFWYAGMHNPELQIMFYGKNIAANDVSVSNNIVIKNIRKTENPNYLFVTIDTKNCPNQDFVFSFSKNKKVSFTKKYTLKKRKENAAFRKSFDASDMFEY
jgi:DNA-binding cell septation regulator SpoVG